MADVKPGFCPASSYRIQTSTFAAMSAIVRNGVERVGTLSLMGNIRA